MTIEEVQTRLRAAHARIGNEGRFALTLTLDGREDCYLTHWFRPEPHAFEDCRAVGSGTLADCLAALDGYVAAHRRHPAPDVARTPGLEDGGVSTRPVAVSPDRWLAAAE